MRKRFFVVAEDAERYWLRAGDLDAAVEEASGLDATEVGQIVDVYRDGQTDPVAVSVDVEG